MDLRAIFKNINSYKNIKKVKEITNLIIRNSKSFMQISLKKIS